MTLVERAVYPTQPAALSRHVQDLLRDAEPEPIHGEIEALIVPDSNLLTGGEVAAEAYKLLAGRVGAYDTAIIIAPSHDGTFDRLSICRVDTYRTPLGEVPVDDRVREELCDEDDDIFLDDRGHYHTEGVDVQLPFLQTLFGGGFSVVPVVMGRETPAFCHELGSAIGEVMYGRRALLVACADLLALEQGALEQFTQALETFDTSALMHLLGSEQVRVEGMGAVIAAVIAAQRRRANRARILRLDPPEGGRPGAMSCVLWRE